MNLKPTPQWVPKHPGASSDAISARMSVARRRDTLPEVAVRGVLLARGLRFRVDYPIPGQRRRTIDIAFTRRRVAVFVDGCFWHGCPEHGTRPQKNSAWWQAKLAANRARDADSDAILRDLGWSVLRVWEHESPELAAARIAEHVAAASLRGADD